MTAAPAHLLLKGEKILESGEALAAVEFYKDLTQKFPDDLSVFEGFSKALCLSDETSNFALVTKTIDSLISRIPSAARSTQLQFYKAFSLERCGKLLEALKNYEICIFFNPAYFEALFNQGNIYLELGKYTQALARFELCSQLKPHDPEGFNNSGVVFDKLGSPLSAIALFNQAIEVDEHFTKAYLNKAWTLLGLDEAGQALEVFHSLVLKNPVLASTSDVNKGIGLAQVHLNRLEEAAASFTKAVSLDPKNPEHFANRGNVFKRLGLLEKAFDDFNVALTLKNDYALVYSNLGNLFKDLGDPAKALLNFSKAIELEPMLAQAHLNKALLLLGQSEFAAGFEEYEWRWATKEYAHQYLQTDLPLLKFSDLVLNQKNDSLKAKNASWKKVILWNEQGLGDDVYFSRFIGLLQKSELELYVRVDPRLCKLLSKAWPSIKFIPEGQQIELGKFDAHIPIGSLACYPLWLGSKSCVWGKDSVSDSESKDMPIKLSRSYLGFDTEEAQILKKSILNQIKGVSTADRQRDLVVGLSWLSTHPITGSIRSIALKQLVKQLDPQLSQPEVLEANLDTSVKLRNIRWVSLQYSNVTEEIDSLAKDCSTVVTEVQGIDLQEDISSLANLMGSCDLVISIDNTTAHLSAALGVETWVLLPTASDWRWQVVTDSIYGYETAKVYRQLKFGDWEELLNRVSKDFRAFTVSH